MSKPNLARLVDAAFADLPLEQRAWLWASIEPDHSPDTASERALDQWNALITGKPRREGETDDELRARVMAAMVPK